MAPNSRSINALDEADETDVSEIDFDEVLDLAERTLRGDVRDRLLRIWKDTLQNGVPIWALLGEIGQGAVVRQADALAQRVVRQCCQIVAEAGRVGVAGILKDTKFKDGNVEFKLVARKSMECARVAMADAGAAFHLVLVDSSAFDGERAAAKIDKDQPDIFDSIDREHERQQAANAATPPDGEISGPQKIAVVALTRVGAAVQLLGEGPEARFCIMAGEGEQRVGVELTRAEWADLHFRDLVEGEEETEAKLTAKGEALAVAIEAMARAEGATPPDGEAPLSEAQRIALGHLARGACHVREFDGPGGEGYHVTPPGDLNERAGVSLTRVEFSQLILVGLVERVEGKGEWTATKAGRARVASEGNAEAAGPVDEPNATSPIPVERVGALLSPAGSAFVTLAPRLVADFAAALTRHPEKIEPFDYGGDRWIVRHEPENLELVIEGDVVQIVAHDDGRTSSVGSTMSAKKVNAFMRAWISARLVEERAAAGQGEQTPAENGHDTRSPEAGEGEAPPAASRITIRDLPQGLTSGRTEQEVAALLPEIVEKTERLRAQPEPDRELAEEVARLWFLSSDDAGMYAVPFKAGDVVEFLPIGGLAADGNTWREAVFLANAFGGPRVLARDPEVGARPLPSGTGKLRSKGDGPPTVWKTPPFRQALNRGGNELADITVAQEHDGRWQWTAGIWTSSGGQSSGGRGVDGVPTSDEAIAAAVGWIKLMCGLYEKKPEMVRGDGARAKAPKPGTTAREVETIRAWLDRVEPGEGRRPASLPEMSLAASVALRMIAEGAPAARGADGGLSVRRGNTVAIIREAESAALVGAGILTTGGALTPLGLLLVSGASPAEPEEPIIDPGSGSASFVLGMMAAAAAPTGRDGRPLVAGEKVAVHFPKGYRGAKAAHEQFGELVEIRGKEGLVRINGKSRAQAFALDRISSPAAGLDLKAAAGSKPGAETSP